MIKLDTYSIKARVYPSFIVLLPALVIAIYYISDLKVYYHYLTAIISFGLLSFILAQLGRDKGKNKEKYLFKVIGGKPTTQILRHSNSYLDNITKSRYHQLLSEKIEGVNLPSLEEEIANPERADATYNGCAKYLISRTRQTEKFNLLFKENINYGFRRNLWGMKSWAIIILISSAILHSLIATDYYSNIKFEPNHDSYPYVAFIILGLFWLLVVTKNWVKLTAFAYAERLYETLEEI